MTRDEAIEVLEPLFEHLKKEMPRAIGWRGGYTLKSQEMEALVVLFPTDIRERITGKVVQS